MTVNWGREAHRRKNYLTTNILHVVEPPTWKLQGEKINFTKNNNNSNQVHFLACLAYSISKFLDLETISWAKIMTIPPSCEQILTQAISKNVK